MKTGSAHLVVVPGVACGILLITIMSGLIFASNAHADVSIGTCLQLCHV